MILCFYALRKNLFRGSLERKKLIVDKKKKENISFIAKMCIRYITNIIQIFKKIEVNSNNCN